MEFPTNTDEVNNLIRPVPIEPVTIICAADEHYALPLAVMLESLSSNANPSRRIDVYIIDCGLSESVRMRISKQVRPNLHFHWQLSTRSRDIGDPSWGHVSGATYERLIIDEYLPGDTTFALWLDCDLLVLDDITTLFQRPLKGHTLLAVRDAFIPSVSSRFGVHNWQELGLTKKQPYFNAGVMLIDMDRWRASEVASRAAQYIQRYGKKVYFNDQEALNAVIGDDWFSLDDRWNCSANPFHARQQSPDRDVPAIIHFSGRIKPWDLPDLGLSQKLFFHYVDKTSWRGNRPHRSAKNLLLSWYVTSHLRTFTYWLENQHLRLRHFLGI
jgi:lipopolysaccharide biosynthesis glycosyltransferase